MDPGVKGPAVIKRSRVAEGGSSNTSYFEMFAHTGTHIDMPWHFNDQGKKILDFRIEDFVFENVLLVDIPKGANQAVKWEELIAYRQQIKESDALLIQTGFSSNRKNNPDSYIHDTPGLSSQTAVELSKFGNLKCIGVDFISVENIGRARSIGYPVHHALLDRREPIILLEDADFSSIQDKKIHRLYLFPLRITDLEASPVTAVVEITD
jgi:kynurenine formamidase